MKHIFTIAVIIVIAGCSIRESHQPPPPEYKLWTKPGASELVVKKALLECGNPSVDPSLYLAKRAGLSVNDMQEINACMELSGFKFRYKGHHRADICVRRPQIPACQGVNIPRPSVERRLNSEYCKRERSYDYCVKTAINPSGCKYSDYKNIVPECLP